MPAAANLLRRSTDLFPEDDNRRLEQLPSLGEAMMEIGEFAWAELFLDQAVKQAGQQGKARLRADAVLTLLLARHHVVEELERWSEEVVHELEGLIPELERLEAHAELAKAWRLLNFVYGSVCRWREQVDAVRRAIDHARLAGDARLEARLTAEYANGLRDGPTQVSEAIGQCEEALARTLADRQAEAFVRCSLARLRAMQGDFGEARDLIAQARAIRDELGPNIIVPLTSVHASRVEFLAGRPEAAEQGLRRDFEKLSAMGDKYLLPLVATLLAWCVYQQNRYDETVELLETVEKLADEEDVEAQAVWRSVKARLLAHNGDFTTAELVAREAVDLLGEIDAPNLHGDCLVALADVLAMAGWPDGAGVALREAADLYSAKGNLVSADRALTLANALPASAA
jgi:tetratricopeptide (TPR) repeat protein